MCVQCFEQIWNKVKNLVRGPSCISYYEIIWEIVSSPILALIKILFCVSRPCDQVLNKITIFVEGKRLLESFTDIVLTSFRWDTCRNNILLYHGNWVVKVLDLAFNGHISIWVRNPPVVYMYVFMWWATTYYHMSIIINV